MTDYYKILGITQNATLEQIKKVYRSKAKVYHPDVNKSEDAHEQFVFLNEAYEYFVKLKDPKQKRQQETKTGREEFWREWQRREKQEARERAQAYAKMRYEAYIKSDIYRTTEAVNTVVDFFAAMFILLLVVGLPLLLYIEHGSIAFLISGIIILPTSPLWLRFLLRTFNKHTFNSFFKKHNASMRSKIVRLLLLSVFNTNLIMT